MKIRAHLKKQKIAQYLSKSKVVQSVGTGRNGTGIFLFAIISRTALWVANMLVPFETINLNMKLIIQFHVLYILRLPPCL